jgi:hypothetical protein
MDEPITYKLRDRQGELLEGSFYEQELTTVKYPDVLLVEKVLKSKMVKGKKQLFVKWLGYDDKFNSWVPESDIMDILEEPPLVSAAPTLRSPSPKYTVTKATPQKIKLKKV